MVVITDDGSCGTNGGSGSDDDGIRMRTVRRNWEEGDDLK